LSFLQARQAVNVPADTPFFLDLRGAGRADDERFARLHLPPDGTVLGAVLYVHPFADEMNKARRMAALQSRALAQAGIAVLQVDLLGCGDSAGDHGDATWAAWVDDVVAAARWLAQRCEGPVNGVAGRPIPLCVWGLRVGALVASAAAARMERCNLLLWQPVMAGKTALHQFLRLKGAGQRAAGRPATSTQQLQQQLQRGEAVDVAGYRLGPGLASGLETMRLQPPAPPQWVLWFDVVARADAGHSPAAQQVLQAWRDDGVAVTPWLVEGPPFWETAEIEDAPALIDATTAAVRSAMIGGGDGP
jgi:exosortase A-associated hydrolase 2